MSHPKNPARAPDACGILARQNRIFNLRKSGHSQQEIARKIGVSTATVSVDLKAAFDRLKAEVESEQVHYARLLTAL